MLKVKGKEKGKGKGKNTRLHPKVLKKNNDSSLTDLDIDDICVVEDVMMRNKKIITSYTKSLAETR